MIRGLFFSMSGVLSSQPPFILHHIQIWCIKIDTTSVHRQHQGTTEHGESLKRHLQSEGGEGRKKMNLFNFTEIINFTDI